MAKPNSITGINQTGKEYLLHHEHILASIQATIPTREVAMVHSDPPHAQISVDFCVEICEKCGSYALGMFERGFRPLTKMKG